MAYIDSGYAIDSPVGPVYDLTKWSGRGHLSMGFAALVFAAGSLAAAAFVYEPAWFFAAPPAELKEAVADLNAAWKSHAIAMQAGVTVAAMFGVLCLLGASMTITDAFRTDYFFRAGPGGIWLRLPNGFSWEHLGLVSKPLELLLPWSEVSSIEVLQVKQLGSLSRNAGNVRAEMTLTARSGEKHVLPLDGLEAAAYLLHERLNEARDAASSDDDWRSAWSPEESAATAAVGGEEAHCVPQ
jgi:hypothetical protein